MEISWRYGLTDYTMPFMINVMREQSMKISTLEKDNEERKVREASQEKIEAETPILGKGPLMITAGPGGPAQPYGNGMAPQATGFMNF
jgi:clathrin heavy chain